MPLHLPAPLQRLRAAPAATALCAAQVLAFGLVVWRAGWPPDAAAQVAAGALERSRVWAGQPWRLLTAPFLHGGWLHLAANVAFGWGWYRLVEQSLGPRAFLALWVAAALGGSAASLLAQDVVSVGASGALFGMVGATLALHRRALPGWRAFATSPAVVQVALSLAIYTGVAVAGQIAIDHAAHAGGLVTGAAGAWLLTRSPPRRAALAAYAAALLLACGAAAWPRPGPTAWQLAEATRATSDALVREDLPAARLASRPLAADGWRTPGAKALHAALLEQGGELDAAVAAAREVLEPRAEAEVPARIWARKILYRIAYRHYVGDRAPRDERRALELAEEACRAGEEPACRAAREITTGTPAAAPAP